MQFHAHQWPKLFSAAYGESERQLREIFERAKKEGPTVVYIDEIDAIAGSRKDSKGQLEKRILTQLLTELDGFEERGQVLVVGSTNMMDSIDDAASSRTFRSTNPCSISRQGWPRAHSQHSYIFDAS